MIKKRSFPESNYSAIYVNGGTLRMPIDTRKPIKELEWPEFYDVGINSLCYGNCPYCYTCATSKGKNFINIIGKIKHFFVEHTDSPADILLFEKIKCSNGFANKPVTKASQIYKSSNPFKTFEKTLVQYQ